MGWWTDQVVPRVANATLGSSKVSVFRREAVAGLHGDVLEVGFGSGLNLPHYPADVDVVWAVEPSMVARRLAEARIAASSAPVEYAGLDGQMLELGDESIDGVLSTFTLCTIPDADAALHEVLRVLRPGGEFHFLEHGLANQPRSVVWQRRLNGVQRHTAGGCNLDRAIDALVAGAGFKMQKLRNDRLPGPRAFGFLYIGVAVKPA